MFAGAAREAVFANPEVIRRVNDEFIAVSVAATHLHQPSSEPERRLLHAIGRSAPAPQGISVLNSDGQVLDWVLMFDDDRSVIDFLNHTITRYREHPDSKKPLQTARYNRFPSQKRGEVAAHDVRLSGTKHPSGERCPAETLHPPGTLIARVVGRRVGGDGKLLRQTVNQEDYAQDRFTIDPGMQAKLWKTLESAGEDRVKVPEELARLWVTYAYMGVLDVRPINNPAGAPCKRSEIEFWAEKDPRNDGWFQLTGRSHAAAEQKRRVGDGAGFESDVQLEWKGFARFEKGLIAELLLSAEGRERLVWNNGMPPGALVGKAEVANLPGGRPVDWEGPVRYGISAQPAHPEQTSADASVTRSPAAAQQAIREKMQQVQQRMRDRMQSGGDARPIARRMQEFQKLMEQGKLAEAEAELGRALEALEKGEL